MEQEEGRKRRGASLRATMVQTTAIQHVVHRINAPGLDVGVSMADWSVPGPDKDGVHMHPDR